MLLVIQLNVTFHFFLKLSSVWLCIFITSVYTASADGEIFPFLMHGIMLSSLPKHKEEQVDFDFEKTVALTVLPGHRVSMLELTKT